MSAPQTLPGAVKHQVVAGFTQAAARYDTGGTEFFTDMGTRLVDQAQIRPGARVLDVGCGKGAVTLPAARLAGDTGRVYAIDLARPMLDAAAAQARACGLGTITVTRGDAEDPPSPAGRFDVILAGNVIQFLPRPAYAVRRWLCLLKPGGTFGFSWGLAQDPRWEPVMAAVDAHVPAGMSGFEAFLRRPPFGGTNPVEQMLTANRLPGRADRHSPGGHRLRQPGAVVGRVPVPGPVGDLLAAHPARPAGRRPPGRLHHPGRPAGPGGTFTRALTFACTTGIAEGDAMTKSALPIRSALETLQLEFPEYRIGQRVIGGTAVLHRGRLRAGVQPVFAQAETVDRLRAKLRIPEVDINAEVPSIARVYDVLLGGKNNFDGGPHTGRAGSGGLPARRRAGRAGAAVPGPRRHLRSPAGHRPVPGRGLRAADRTEHPPDRPGDRPGRAGRVRR